MAEIVPVDQFLDWYPGWTPELTDSPWVADRSGPFTKADEEPLLVRRLPLASRLLADRLPVRHGLRVVGHADGRALAAPARRRRAWSSAWAARSRYEGEVPHDLRVGARLPGRSASSGTCPSSSRTSTRSGMRGSGSSSSASSYFESYDFAGKSLADIGQFITDARTFHRRAWEIHFELMYPLLGIYLQLYGLCASNGIDPGQRVEVLPGPRLARSWRPTGRCGTWWPRPGGSASPTSSTPSPSRSATASPRPAATRRCGSRSFDDFLKVLRLAHRGHRRHEHPVVDREPGLAARPDPQLPRRWTSRTTSRRRPPPPAPSATRPSTPPARS